MAAKSLLVARELSMVTIEIMEDIHQNQDSLPVLTEVVTPKSQATGESGRGVVNRQLAVIESDPGDYDPYNSAPPVPSDKEAFL